MRDVMEQTSPARPFWLRVLQHPLVRLAVLGLIFFVLIGISNGFMAQFSAQFNSHYLPSLPNSPWY